MYGHMARKSRKVPASFHLQSLYVVWEIYATICPEGFNLSGELANVNVRPLRHVSLRDQEQRKLSLLQVGTFQNPTLASYNIVM